MSKTFFQVFPTLEVEKRIKRLLENTKVERVTSNRARDFLRIYLVSDHLVQKPDLWEVEKLIQKQLFPNLSMTVKIQEKFYLSHQYTLKNLMEEYKKSILAELENYNHILHSMLKNASISYPEEGKLLLSLKDTILYRHQQEEFLRVLEKVIVERCGISSILTVEYLPGEEEAYRKEDEMILQQKIAEISQKASQKTREEQEFVLKTEEAQAKEVQKQSIQKSAPKEEEKPAYRRPQKKSDNPEVIYGRDFEEEAMPISDIIGEMGEVTIRGQIISTDQREIRNEKNHFILLGIDAEVF